MREEVNNAIHYIMDKFPREAKPDHLAIYKEYGQVVEKIINILEENKMTYDDAYAILEVTYEALKYKATRLYL